MALIASLLSFDLSGSMFASIATVEVFGSIFATVGENVVYSATLTFMNCFVFLVMAAFVCVNLSMLM